MTAKVSDSSHNQVRSRISGRLREERIRIGATQSQLASDLGYSKTAQCNYEKGYRTPDAEYLAVAHSIGVDVLYVVTGIRAPQTHSDHEILAGVRTHPEAFAIGLLLRALADREAAL